MWIMLAATMMVLSLIAYTVSVIPKGGYRPLPAHLGISGSGADDGLLRAGWHGILSDLFRLPLLLVRKATRHSWDCRRREITLSRGSIPGERRPARTRLPPYCKRADIGRHPDLCHGRWHSGAGWTAQVLTGLAETLESEYPDEFARKVRLVSSVSGGSLGTLYFLEAYQDNGTLPMEKTKDGQSVLRRVVDAAERSSLDELAFGLIYIDPLARVVSLRLAEKHLLNNDPAGIGWSGPGHGSCGNTRCMDASYRGGEAGGGVVSGKAGVRPLSLMRSIAETGRSCWGRRTWGVRAGTTTGCKAKPSARQPRRPRGPRIQGTRQFYDRIQRSGHPSRDSSASFGHVPFCHAGSADRPGRLLHESVPCRGRRILRQLRHGDSGGVAGGSAARSWAGEAGTGDSGSRREGEMQPQANHGGYFQFLAPLLALNHVRDTTQLSRNNEELYLLRRNSSDVALTTAVFQYAPKMVGRQSEPAAALLAFDAAGKRGHSGGVERLR